MYDLTQPVLTKAGEIRAAARASGRRNMTAADSHFVATALLYCASALHTFDDKLLRWSGSALVDGLIICRPRAEQTLLDI